MSHLLAQNSTSLGPIGGGDGLGPFGKYLYSGQGGAINALTLISQGISAILGLMTVAAGIWFIFMFLIGGYTWMTSFGDKHKLEEARNRIVNALIGLVIVVSAWGITALAGKFFGWDILITDPTKIIQSLTIGG